MLYFYVCERISAEGYLKQFEYSFRFPALSIWPFDLQIQANPMLMFFGQSDADGEDMKSIEERWQTELIAWGLDDIMFPVCSCDFVSCGQALKQSPKSI